VRAIGLLTIMSGAVGVGPTTAQRAPQVFFDSALVAEAFAEFALLPYQPLAIEQRYWSLRNKPGAPIATESMQVLTRLISATAGRAEELLHCPNESPGTVLHAGCSLRHVGALLALSAPEQIGDTVRQEITVFMAGERKGGARGEMHRILLWFLPSGADWRAIQREVVWNTSRRP
jgi:hypothetical protein